MRIETTFILVGFWSLSSVLSLRLHNSGGISRRAVKQTSLNSFPEFSEVYQTAKSLAFPVEVFVAGYGTALVGQSVAITDELQFFFNRLRRLLNLFDFLQSVLNPKKNPYATLFPNVFLPKELKRGQSEEELLYLTGSSSIKIGKFGLDTILALNKVVGKDKLLSNKTSNFKALSEVHNLYAEKIIKKGRVRNSFLPDDYNYFGVDDGIGNLRAMLKYNPFFANALTTTSSGFEIDPYGKTTQFTTFTSSFNDNVPRVVAQFDKNLNVKSLKAYTGKTLKDRVEVKTYSENEKAYLLLFTLLYSGQNIHATTHVSSSLRWFVFFLQSLILICILSHLAFPPAAHDVSGTGHRTIQGILQLV